ncbi:MAG: gephyrin-like molybdotransferase Glp [Desulfobacterales bacterium]
MKAFFNVIDLEEAFAFVPNVSPVDTETIPLTGAANRILAEDIVSDVDLPDFPRSTMDGYAVGAASTFGASEANPAYLTLTETVTMGDAPSFSIGPGQAARISTGGMLPEGANSVVMIEYAEAIDETTLEVYRSVAPGQHAIEKGEDFKKGAVILECGRRLRAQEIGLLAAFGQENICCYRKPVISIISTGDEIVPIDQAPGMAQIRDINTYTLSSLVEQSGGIPLILGIIGDNLEALFDACSQALAQSDMVLISGGSSVGTRDFSIEALSALPDADILIHGIAISPGKPTILATSGKKALWGLPGHVVSAMVVFQVVVKPFIDRVRGLIETTDQNAMPTAFLSRNIASAQGRVDFIRVRLHHKDQRLYAEPILGKSGLINTMVKADGLVKIDQHTEGLDEGALVEILPV